MRFMTGLMLLSSLLISNESPAPTIIGNSADAVIFIYGDAQKEAAARLDLMPSEHIASHVVDVAPSLVEWVAANKDALADDIRRSTHEWHATAPVWQGCMPTACACVGLGDVGGPIHLQFDACRAVSASPTHVRRLLVHESSHHLGVDDEASATIIAEIVEKAWETYHPDRQSGSFVPSAGVPEPLVPHRQDVSFALGMRIGRWSSNSGGGAVLGIYDSARDTWQVSRPTSAASRLDPLIVVAEDAIVALESGRSGASQANGRWGLVYDRLADQWELLPDGGSPTSRRLFSAVTGANKVFIFGGDAARPPLRSRELGDGAIFDLRTRTWQSMSSRGAPAPRSGHVAVWTGSAMLVWGGTSIDDQGNMTQANTGAAYDPATDSWTPMAPGPSACIDLRALWIGEKLLMIGHCGRDGAATVATYDPRGDHWTTLPNGGPTHISAAAVTDGRLYVMGGDRDWSTRDLWSYDLIRGSWTKNDHIELPDLAYDLIAADGTLVAVGAYEYWVMPTR